MTILALVMFGVILVLVTLYIIIYVIYPGSGNNDVLTAITPLSERKDIVMSDLVKNTLLATSGSTVMGYFKLEGGDRTQSISNGYNPLLYVANNWYLEIAPTITTTGTSARLRVKTMNGKNIDEEIIELPSIPRQKWVFIAVLRDGRRFDVIYDNQIVASQRLSNYPTVINSPLTIGNKGLDGSAIHIMINSKRLTPYAVERERESHIDTNGQVLEDNKIDMSFPGLKLFARCPPGLPCDPITKPPSNNLLEWSTPYA
jgi:hypothetical protein